jgi:hypothetical protein
MHLLCEWVTAWKGVARRSTVPRILTVAHPPWYSRDFTVAFCCSPMAWVQVECGMMYRKFPNNSWTFAYSLRICNESIVALLLAQLIYVIVNVHRVRKRLYPFFIFFSRCPVCGEWCKLHWLLLDTPSFDW